MFKETAKDNNLTLKSYRQGLWLALALPNSVLCLQTEKEARRKTLDVVHTEDMVITHWGRQVSWLKIKWVLKNDEKVTMGVQHKVPYGSKYHPRDVEGCSKAEQCPRPGKVYHWSKEVLQISKHDVDDLFKIVILY